MAERRSPTRALVSVLLCSALLMHAREASGALQCLTPAAETALRQILDAGTLRETLGNDLTIESVNMAGDRIELRVTDRSGRRFGVNLNLSSDWFNLGADGHGTRFVFHLLRTDTLEERHDKALLAAAEQIDRAIPDAALAECGGAPSEGGKPPPAPDFYTRASALGSAIIQVAILLGASVYSWHSIRRYS